MPWTTPPDNQYTGVDTRLYVLQLPGGGSTTVAVKGGNAIAATDGTHRAQIPYGRDTPLPQVYQH